MNDIKLEVELTAFPTDTFAALFGEPVKPTHSVMIEHTDHRPAEPRRPLRQRGLRGWLRHRRAMRTYRELHRQWVAKGSPATVPVLLRTYIPRAQIRAKEAS